MWIENVDQTALVNSEHLTHIEVVPDDLGAEVVGVLTNGIKEVLFRGTYNQAVAHVRNLERILRLNFG